MAPSLNKTQQTQVEGDRIRRAIIDWLANKFTEPSCPAAAISRIWVAP
jgi:hypothetical protein